MSESLLARWRSRFWGAHETVSHGEWSRLCQGSSLIARYASVGRSRLRELCDAFLRRKQFEGARGLEVDDEIRLLIAAQACIPILGLSLEWLDGWRSIIVYPGDFVVRRTTVDEAGVVSESDDPLSGEAWNRGPVIVSLEGVREDARGEYWGNLVIHEIAHKLDMCNGVANGMPPLHRDMDRNRWTEVWSAAYDTLAEEYERGWDPWVGEGALEDPAEFFATMSEAFFTCPSDLQDAHGEVYAELSRFYRQHPAVRASPARSDSSLWI